MRRLGGTALAASLALAVFAGVASAHALPQSSSPSPGASLAQAPPRVSIVFGERPDAKLSSIRVLDASGSPVTAGSTSVAPGNVDELVVALEPLGAGVYTVAWRTVSAVDGHNATGSFAFGVGGAKPSPGATATGPGGSASGPSAAAIVARWLLYVGLIALLGASFFATAVSGSATVIAKRLVPLAWLVAVAGTAGVVAVQLSDAGVELGGVLGTSFGPVIVERFIPLAVAGVAIVVLLARAAAVRWAVTVIALAAASAMLADVGASHAAAGQLPILEVAIQWLHVLAVGGWIGGLGGLLLSLRREPGPETARIARRFSYVGTVGIGVVAGTGLLRAIAEVGTIDQLFSTDFGRLVVIKTGLLGVLALLGAFNHFINVPAAARRVSWLRRAGSTEILIGATVVVFSASLVNLAPPVEAGGGGAGPSASPTASQAPLTVTGNDFGTSVRLTMVITPGMAGFNTFSATVSDFDSGEPVPASGLTLRFSLPSHPEVGASRLDLQPSGSGTGTFTATGANLSIAGTWSVAATVVNGPSSVEVPLTITTQCPVAPGPSPAISVNAESGLPTIYTASLSAGRTVQVYLDPGTAGKNEEHVTFFDPSGNELPVQTVTMSLGASSCTESALTPRQLEPGHFVADTTLTTGTYTTSIAGPAPNGDQLAVQLDVVVK